MATAPQFGASPVYAYNTSVITAANTSADGTGTVVFLQTNTAGTAADWAAGPGGAFIDQIVIIPKGTNVATVMRFFTNSGATNATAANNDLLVEATCPSSTVSQTAAQAPVIVSIKRWFPEGTKIFATIGTAVAAGFSVSMYGSQM